jgi:hypothetical protein
MFPPEERIASALLDYDSIPGLCRVGRQIRFPNTKSPRDPNIQVPCIHTIHHNTMAKESSKQSLTVSPLPTVFV